LTFVEVKPTGSSRPCGLYRPSISEPTCRFAQIRKLPDDAIGGSQALDLDHRAVAGQILAAQPLGETTTAAPLAVKGKVFVGISGGEMSFRARAEQSEPLSGANARLCPCRET
jgi:hypothetical protein